MKKTIKKVVDGIERKIVINANYGRSQIEFFEDKELQLLVTIPEDIINLEEARFEQKKYASIFKYYMERGIWDLSYKDVKSMINTRRRKCYIFFIFHNKNGIDIDLDIDNNSCFTAYYRETINGVLFEYTSYYNENFKYRELNELDKTDELDLDIAWERNIFQEDYCNEHGETCVTIQVNGVPYSMLEVMYNRLNSDEYLDNRNFFEEGSTLFDITKEQSRLLTKNSILKQQENFIKYVEFDGSIII